MIRVIMDPQVADALRPALARMQDASLPRRDCDRARREALVALERRGLALQQRHSSFAIGRWEPRGSTDEEFVPLYLVGPTGELKALRDEAPPAPGLDAWRARIAGWAVEAADPGSAAPVFARVFAELGDDQALNAADAAEVTELLDPLLDAALPHAGDAYAAALAAVSATRRVAGVIVFRLSSWAAGHPSWAPPPALDRYWIAARPSHFARAWGGAADLAARAGPRMDPLLLDFIEPLECTPGDADWVAIVWAKRADAIAIERLWDAIERFRGRGQHEHVDIVLPNLVAALEARADAGAASAAADRVDPMIAAGVAAGIDMQNALESVRRLRAQVRPNPVRGDLAARGVAFPHLKVAATRRFTPGHAPYVDLATGRLHDLLPAWLGIEPTGEPPVPLTRRWPVPALSRAEYVAMVREIAPRLGPKHAARVAELARDPAFMRRIPNSLIGDAAAWRAWYDAIDEWEDAFVDEVVRKLVAAIDGHRGPSAPAGR